MGIHGNATCVMNYDEATGYLIGEENAGLKAMFVMMNEARLGVGLQGQATAKSPIRTPPPMPANGCRAARCPGAKAPEKKADPIIVHPDVRRTLMTIRAFNEAAARWCCGPR
jgi:acyl-CoA dehydrogenase